MKEALFGSFLTLKDRSQPSQNDIVTEYKRFMVLAALMEVEATSSKIVDEAWHLHLLDSLHYREKMCHEVLSRFIDHHRRNIGEDNKFSSRYVETLTTYQAVFGEKPPRDIWIRSAKED